MDYVSRKAFAQGDGASGSFVKAREETGDSRAPAQGFEGAGLKRCPPQDAGQPLCGLFSPSVTDPCVLGTLRDCHCSFAGGSQRVDVLL